MLDSKAHYWNVINTCNKVHLFRKFLSSFLLFIIKVFINAKWNKEVAVDNIEMLNNIETLFYFTIP